MYINFCVYCIINNIQDNYFYTCNIVHVHFGIRIGISSMIYIDICYFLFTLQAIDTFAFVSQ